MHPTDGAKDIGRDPLRIVRPGPRGLLYDLHVQVLRPVHVPHFLPRTVHAGHQSLHRGRDGRRRDRRIHQRFPQMVAYGDGRADGRDTILPLPLAEALSQRPGVDSLHGRSAVFRRGLLGPRNIHRLVGLAAVDRAQLHMHRSPALSGFRARGGRLLVAGGDRVGARCHQRRLAFRQLHFGHEFFFSILHFLSGFYVSCTPGGGL
mmetsp:Transcript_14874/g.33002  ORF Transcript_14874/g.33002 Transcript_14874/m.33002 type:complete len:205 (+) Transcript_14874:743-1357(+)